MAKTSGLGAAISVEDSDAEAQTITNDVTNFTMSTPQALQDITGVDKYAHERLGLLQDVTFGLNGVFNPAANMSHAVLSSLVNTRLVKITPTSNSTPYLSANCLIGGYDVTRSATGELTWTSPLSLEDGSAPSWTNS